MKHTKGPWVADIQGASSYVRQEQTSQFESGAMVAKTWGAADARLIACAPELLDEMQWLLEYLKRNTLGTVELEFGRGTVVDRHLIETRIRGLIARIEGNE